MEERLTNKAFGFLPPKNIKKWRQDYYRKMEDKLCQYENIDESLGINYIILVKAIALGIYYKNPLHNNRVEYECIPDLYPIITFDEEDGNYWIVLEQFLRDKSSSGKLKLYFSDYGKTWALTMEELK